VKSSSVCFLFSFSIFTVHIICMSSIRLPSSQIFSHFCHHCALFWFILLAFVIDFFDCHLFYLTFHLPYICQFISLLIVLFSASLFLPFYLFYLFILLLFSVLPSLYIISLLSSFKFNMIVFLPPSFPFSYLPALALPRLLPNSFVFTPFLV